MNTLPEARGARLGATTHPDTTTAREESFAIQFGRPRWPAVLARLRWPLAVYAGSRLLFLAIALGDSLLQHWSLRAEVSNWDGVWYLMLAGHGYPTHVTHLQSTLGFFPLYPIVLWVVSHVLFCSEIVAGLVVATIGGFVATVLVQRLSAGWWGEEAGRRAVLAFCLFPGSIVFSMVYTEGLLLSLVAGCILALERKRWLLAGGLAAAATATGAVGIAIIPVCVVSAALELRRRGWGDPRALRALAAPLLAPVGIVAFAAFLWIWTGSPFASYTAQHHGWNESTDLLAIAHTAGHVVSQVAAFHTLHHPGINLNYVSGIVGAAFLLTALVLLFNTRPRISVEGLVWTVGIAFLTLTSANVPPNPRMLICAFPAVVVFAYRLRGRPFAALIMASTVVLIAMSYVSFVGTGLRP